ncbi:hypothetical protein TSUD_283050 [Trifolium subterraneum]|uniref:Uncharacterized protein n=1 Tax=Trifolium subterraneum TaxID=3900 RepID=A0A2Z6P2L1_TRISU|nr:hypothetical protein TSUD_283050 [Trifolium subterraneum]
MCTLGYEWQQYDQHGWHGWQQIIRFLKLVVKVWYQTHMIDSHLQNVVRAVFVSSITVAAVSHIALSISLGSEASFASRALDLLEALARVLISVMQFLCCRTGFDPLLVAL